MIHLFCDDCINAFGIFIDFVGGIFVQYGGWSGDKMRSMAVGEHLSNSLMVVAHAYGQQSIQDLMLRWRHMTAELKTKLHVQTWRLEGLCVHGKPPLDSKSPEPGP